MRAYEAALTAPWAMTEDWIETVLSIAAREHEVSHEALEGYRARAVQGGERLTARGSVGIITARGPMFRYANLFTEMSGATSYETLRLDLQAAVDNPDIKSILLNVDSPGGQANGASELADSIRAANEKKPVVAYVGGTSASAGYWMTAAAGEVVISDSAVLGSIGVRMAVPDTRAQDAARGLRVHEFVSSQSPGKDRNAALDSDEGRARIQEQIDAMAQVFIDKIAAYRGVSPEHVIAKFGAGGVKVGAHAVTAGMADRIGSFEGLVTELSQAHPGHTTQRSTKGNQMSHSKTDNTTAEDTAKAEAEAKAAGEAKAAADAKTAADAKVVADPRERIKAILELDEAKGRDEQAKAIALDTDLSVEQAKSLLAKAPKAQATATIAERARGNGADVSAAAARGNANPWAKVVDRVNARFGGAQRTA